MVRFTPDHPACTNLLSVAQSLLATDNLAVVRPGTVGAVLEGPDHPEQPEASNVGGNEARCVPDGEEGLEALPASVLITPRWPGTVGAVRQAGSHRNRQAHTSVVRPCKDKAHRQTSVSD